MTHLEISRIADDGQYGRSAPLAQRKSELLLLDEPTAGVDPKARREFWEQIHALAAGGIPVFLCEQRS